MKMGILHLAGLGRSPGAVTCGLSYIQGLHGIRSKELGKTVDEVVVFTSREVAEGQLRTTGTVSLNQYGQTKCWDKQWPVAPVLDVLTDAFAALFPQAVLHVCSVDLNDFYDCLRAVAQSIHHFHPRGKTGRHIQVNLTGGTNVLNSALFLGSNLSGVVAKFYYTFVEPTQAGCLRPIADNESERFRYQELPLLTTGARIDERLHYLLTALVDLPADSDGIHEDELWSRVADVFKPAGIERAGFRRDYLNVLDGQFLRRPGSRDEDGLDTRTGHVHLTADGRKLLKVVESPWFRALHRDSSLPSTSQEELAEGLDLIQRWPPR